ncbi:MAG TPA: glycosyltransferase family 39 protein, partial [Chloroflexota bacterium]|nr:glycosyltransferase family 39 protein [Chloroflexota bacterium]
MRLMKRIHPALLLLAFVLVVYFVSASWGIENPGIEYDEILFGNAAMGIQDHSFIFWAADVGGKRLPIMLMSYIGALKAYLFFPIARFVGFDPLSIRLPGILIGALSLLLYTAFARRVVGLRGALLFALLLATDPSYLYHTRLDWGPVVLMLFVKAAGALLFLRWWESNRLRELAASGLLLGLGVFDKVNFLWFLIAAVLALLLVYGGELLHRVSPVN